MKKILLFFLLLTSCGSDDVNCPYAELPILINAPDDLTLEAIDIWNEAMGVPVFEDSDSGVSVKYVDSL